MTPYDTQPTPTSTPNQRGFTLVELMVSILIGLFLVGGLLTLVQAMKRTSVSQSGLSQLQDNERMAMQLMTDVIQSTGYFITPLSNTAATSFPVTGSFTYAGQALYGTTVGGSDQISVRYMTTGSDNIINCSGNTYTTGSATFINTFSVNTATDTLQCTLTTNGGTATTVPLISGITNLSILYGVQTNTSVSTYSVDCYLTAANVTSWQSVKSVKVSITFVNPMYGNLAGQTTNTPQTITFTRVIDVMNNTGVIT